MTKRCPACRQAREAKGFVAGLCPACFGGGAPIPLGHTEPLTTKALVRLSGGRHGKRIDSLETTTRQEETTMTAGSMTKRPCPKCGREFLPAGYGRHVPNCTGSRSEAEARQPPSKPAPPRPPIDAGRRASPDGACAQCLFRGLEQHIAQDLFAKAIRGGMAVDAAGEFVRSAQAAFSR